MPLDALTTQRIRSLEIVVAWLIENQLDASLDYPLSSYAAANPTYILELAENIIEGNEEEE